MHGNSVLYYLIFLRQSASLPFDLATVRGLTAQKRTVARCRCSVPQIEVNAKNRFTHDDVKKSFQILEFLRRVNLRTFPFSLLKIPLGDFPNVKYIRYTCLTKSLNIVYPFIFVRFFQEKL